MSASSYRSVALAVWWRNAHNFFSNPALLIPGVMFPMFFFIAFAGGLSRIDSAPGFDFDGGYTAFVYGFVLLQASIFGGIFNGFSVARDFEGGFSRRMLVAAPRRSAIIVGYVLSAITRAAFTIAIVTAVALISGMELGGSAGELAALYAMVVLLNMGASLFGIGVAMRFRTMQAAPMMQTPAFLFLFLAPVWVPLDLVAGWVHSVAQFNPATAFLQAGRGFISGEPTKVLLAFALAGGLAAAFSLFALRGLRSAERSA